MARNMYGIGRGVEGSEIAIAAAQVVAEEKGLDVSFHQVDGRFVIPSINLKNLPPIARSEASMQKLLQTAVEIDSFIATDISGIVPIKFAVFGKEQDKVRLKFTDDAEQSRLIDHAALNDALYDMGLYRTAASPQYKSMPVVQCEDASAAQHIKEAMDTTLEALTIDAHWTGGLVLSEMEVYEVPQWLEPQVRQHIPTGRGPYRKD